jgi:hypothetical protein
MSRLSKLENLNNNLIDTLETSTKEIYEQFNKLSLSIPTFKKGDIHYFVIINREYDSYYLLHSGDCFRMKNNLIL